jgi:hypothetical protein
VGIVRELSWVCTIIVSTHWDVMGETAQDKDFGAFKERLTLRGRGAPVDLHSLLRTAASRTSRSWVDCRLSSRSRRSRHRGSAFGLRRAGKIQPVRAMDHVHQREQDHRRLPAENMADRAHHRRNSRA